MAKIKEDLTGRKQFKITVLERVDKPSNLRQNGSYWKYICICGGSSIAHRTTIVRGLKSCGCSYKEKKYNGPKTPHYRRLYNVWKAAYYRCYQPLNKYYKSYGGRGIKMSEEWKDFGVFLTDMLPTYQSGLTLERIDVDGDYCKENCTWITNKAQASNRRTGLAYRKKHGLP
jgi:hypothetical protein